MDHEIIYAKTAAGEQAMLERNRTMARNVRMVLILVDSQSSVGDLCLKTGNPQLTESALRELEKGGYIEPRRQQEALGNDEIRLAQEVRAAIGSKRARQAATSVVPESRSLTPGRADQDSAVAADATQHTEGAEVATAIEEASASSINSRLKGLFSRPQATTGAEGGEVRSIPAEPSQARAGDDSETAHDDTPPPSRQAAQPKARVHRRRPPFARSATIALTLVGLLAALALTVWLFPYARYLAQVEAAMTRICGLPVKISTLRVELLPRPQLRLGGVRFGADGDEVHIAELRLEPELGTLFSDDRRYEAVVVSGTTLAVETIVALPGVFSSLAQSVPPVQFRRIGFEKTTLSLAGLTVAQMSGEAGLSAAGQLLALRLSAPDRSLSIAATPAAQGVSLAIEAIAWRPSPASPLVFDSIAADAHYSQGTLTIKRMQLRLFDGLVEGQATITSGPGQNASGELAFQRINAARLGDAIGFKQGLSGEIAGQLRFSTQGEDWGRLGEALKADGEFSVRRGSVRGIDLSEAARRVSGAPVQGGETRFESLEGKIKLTPTACLFSELILNSGLMQASGQISVGSEQALSGSMELRMRGTANRTRVPLSIGGTLAAPSVRIGSGDSR